MINSIKESVIFIMSDSDNSEHDSRSLDWDKAECFEDLLELSKVSLIKGLTTPTSYLYPETNNILATESMPYMADFLKMHDLGYLTVDSQPGTIESYVDQNLSSRHFGYHCIDSQREYINGLMDINQAFRIAHFLENDKDICIVVYYDDNHCKVYNKPTSDVDEHRINLTKSEYPNCTHQFTGCCIQGCHIEKYFGSMSRIVGNVPNLVGIYFIHHKYGNSDLNARIIEALEKTYLK